MIEEIIKKHISNVNSFIDDNGHNRFMDCVGELAKYITENYQPKTTSTDIEGLRKEFFEAFTDVVWEDGKGGDLIMHIVDKSGVIVGKKKIFEWFAPHLSNKSELKKEAVGERKVKVYNSDSSVVRSGKGNVMSKISEGYSKFGALIDFDEINSLLGQLLTYTDATYSDLEQRNAHKSIVKKLVRDWYYACEKELPVFARGEFEDSVPLPKKVTLTFGIWDGDKLGSVN